MKYLWPWTWTQKAPLMNGQMKNEKNLTFGY